MPHKRAKRSVREQQRSQKGSDLAPSQLQLSLSQEAIPKSLARVLNAAKVREEWRKRKLEDGETEEKNGTKKKQKLNEKTHSKTKSIMPGESLQHYNKRVETDMRPLVKSAVQSSKLAIRHAQRQEIASKSKRDAVEHPMPSSEPPTAQHPGRPTEFQTLSTSTPRRLNDIAQSPPEFNHLPRGVDSSSKVSKTKVEQRDGVISLAQKEMMKQEREKAIARYRELRAYRKKDHNEEEVQD
ncbi:hypothetical protein GGU10DRAFT_314657 [Lentinula aff. detonsa]|uniref:Uncharacterized protein n=1 Tax=Lentinula aff. detonsa TaxID=2804958 RepID=A0AA38NPF4_9AGAR|nr:hypothetical protein GGU10DRAFT_314657 [Lentinula aff. detonsa]